jgi:histone H1/5
MSATSSSSSSCLPSNKSYLDLANEAILSLQKRSGSSLQAIKQHIQSQYPDLDLKSHYLRAALKKAVSQERLVRVKGSFKISSAEKKVLMRRRSLTSSVLKAQSPSLASLSSHLQARTKQQSKQHSPPIAKCAPSSPSPSKAEPLKSPSSPSCPSRARRVVSRATPPTLRSSNIKRRLRSSLGSASLGASPYRGRGIFA